MIRLNSIPTKSFSRLIITLPIIVLAVDDLRLRRIQFKIAFRQPVPKGLQHRLRLVLAPAMDDRVIRIPSATSWALKSTESPQESKIMANGTIAMRWLSSVSDMVTFHSGDMLSARASNG